MKVSEAVVLMAGAGSRLRSGASALPKPLVPILGRPLISYTFAALERAGVEVVYAVVGFESGFVRQAVTKLITTGLEVVFVENPDWQKQNGISVLAAAQRVHRPFLLTMSDHLFDQEILDRLCEHSTPNELNLAVDRKVDAIFDLDDAMKVQTNGNRIVAIGKELESYDAIDTGVFVCPPSIFEYLQAAKRGNDCSLADGVRAMAAQGLAQAVEIGNAWWQDVDTPEMLSVAEKHLSARQATSAHEVAASREP